MHDTNQGSTSNHFMEEELVLGIPASTRWRVLPCTDAYTLSLEIGFQKKEIAALLLTGW